VVGAAGAEHEAFHAHAERRAFALDALPDEHAAAVQSFDLARLGTDLIGRAAAAAHSSYSSLSVPI